VDHWLTFSVGPLACSSEFGDNVNQLASVLAKAQFLVNGTLSAADYAVFGALKANPEWLEAIKAGSANKFLSKWYNDFAGRPEVKEALAKVPADVVAKKKSPVSSSTSNHQKRRTTSTSKGGAKGGKPAGGQQGTKEQSGGGKFVDLPGAEKGKIVVRFPPEASG